MWQMHKLLFISTLLLGTLISISSYTWMGMWMGLEINLLSFLPLISDDKNMFASEAALKYFITQAIASTILLFSVILLSSKIMFFMHNMALSMILNSSLLLKMGAAPLHFWFPEVLEGMSWTTGLLLLTWQKIAPMILLIYSNKTLFLLTVVIISCMIVSGVMGQNQLSLRKIMAYSSINHIGWMIAASLFLEFIWLIYFTIYSVITLNIIILFKKLNITHLKHLTLSMDNNTNIKLFFILNFLSLGGLPPFLGFFPKWLTIQIMTEFNLNFLAVIMIISTLMTLFFYMRVSFSSMLLTMNTIPLNPSASKHMFFVVSTNLVTLASLIMVTLAFNFL